MKGAVPIDENVLSSAIEAQAASKDLAVAIARSVIEVSEMAGNAATALPFDAGPSAYFSMLESISCDEE